jgi:protein-arginine kinase activator protein McsA
LDRAVAGEDYESAAQLRDRIRSMEGPGGPHG